MRAVRSRPEAQAWTTPALQSAALHCCTQPRCSQSAKEGERGIQGGDKTVGVAVLLNCSTRRVSTPQWLPTGVSSGAVRGRVRAQAWARAKAKAGRAGGKQRETGTCTSQRLYSARKQDRKQNTQNKQQKRIVLCVCLKLFVCVSCA